MCSVYHKSRDLSSVFNVLRVIQQALYKGIILWKDARGKGPAIWREQMDRILVVMKMDEDQRDMLKEAAPASRIDFVNPGV